MKKKLLSMLCLVALTLFMAGSALALTLDYAAVTGASIEFTGSGDTFTFLPTAGSGSPNFTITDTHGASDLTTKGLFGTMGGTFTIGAITIAGGLQTAPITGSGTFTITDQGSPSNVLSATLTWVDIYTLGTGGNINTLGTANLSNVTYTGSNPDLLAFLQGGVNTLTFQFLPAPGLTLTQLTTDGQVHRTSFSGSLAPVPIPPTALLLGSGLFGLAGLGWRTRRKS